MHLFYYALAVAGIDRYHAQVFNYSFITAKKGVYHAVRFNPPFNSQLFAAQKPEAIPFFCATSFGLLSSYFVNCI